MRQDSWELGSATLDAGAASQFVAASFERAFPGRICAVYVDGSFADGSGLVTSDLDMTVAFADAFRDATEREAAEQLCHSVAEDYPIELDVGVVDEAMLQRGVSPMLKFASVLVAGDDIRDRLPVVPLAEWTRDRMHAAAWLAIRLHGRPVPVVCPVGYPDADDELFGYARRTIRLPDGTSIPTTRDLIRSTGWAATALVAQRAGHYVARKRECHALYAEHIGDEWSDLLCDLYECCRGRWRYRIPGDVVERERLRAICARTLGFENHFLDVYRRFLLAELLGPDSSGRKAAREAWDRLPFEDENIARAAGR